MVLRSKTIGDDLPACVMGVINCSPESFYKPSVKTGSKNLSEYALKIIEDGADIIDIGAASTAPASIYPDSEYVSEGVELQRIEESLPVLRNLTDIPISVDTMRAKVADKALRLGADILNDVSGLKKDKNMLKVLRDYSPNLVIMASNREPGDVRTLQELISSIRDSVKLALDAGVEESKIIIDPGLGFGKSLDFNIQILKNIHLLKAFRKPILVGVSRKSFLKAAVNSNLDQDVATASITATVIAILNGAHIIRTHDVREIKISSKFISRYRESK